MIDYDVIIVGAGPAGIGVASLLSQSDLNHLILDKSEIGNSFLDWPKNMEMITPSFPSNAFGQMDLNSIFESTSPAFAFNKEHLTGDEYAIYLSGVADYRDLNIEKNNEVKKVNEEENSWVVETKKGTYSCKYLIWAAGEFQNPKIENISGKKHCIHSSLIKSPDELKEDNFVVIGGYESGIQVAFDLIKNNKKATVINKDVIDDMDTSDPSQVLSPYTYQKYNELKDSDLYTEIIGKVKGVTKTENGYQVKLKNNTRFETESKPICATGFSLVKKPIEHLITNREDGFPKLNEKTDEFFKKKNIYLTGPSVRHDEHIFCFIYKFRQRFGVIVEDILLKEEYEKENVSVLVDGWKRNGMYLSDLSCCGEECVC